MADLEQALASAREVLALFGADVLQKNIWGSPMGKTHLARRIVAEIPEHRVYVEPFAGGGKILFTKDASEVEVVADLDPEIAFAFKFTKSHARADRGAAAQEVGRRQGAFPQARAVRGAR